MDNLTRLQLVNDKYIVLQVIVTFFSHISSLGFTDTTGSFVMVLYTLFLKLFIGANIIHTKIKTPYFTFCVYFQNIKKLYYDGFHSLGQR